MAQQNNNKEEKAAIGHVQSREIVEEMRESYLDYAMSVIVARALPDVRDGLKPVHRRILFAMHEDGLTHSAKYRKSATVIGSVLGRYHPHGDAAVYDAMARMAQDFSLRYPLVDGQGNWGSIDGDSPAAYRYCVTGDTMVVTNNGLQRIDTISTNEQIDNLSVLSHGRSINAASKWFDSGIHPTKKITTLKGYSVQGSLNHPILVLQQDVQGKPVFHWKILSDIEEGDTVIIDRSRDILWPTKELDLTPYVPVNWKPRGIRVLPQFFTEDLAMIMGAFISEGSVTKGKIEFCNTDFTWIEDIRNRWSKLFSDSTLHMFKRNPSSYGKKSYARLECHWQYTLAFLRNIGLVNVKSAKKRVPSLIFQSPKHVVAAFLRSYFEGDGGTILGKRRFDLFACSASQDLLKDIQLILLRFGIDSFLRYDASRKLYVLYVRGIHNLRLFQEEIGFISDRKQRKLASYLSSVDTEFSKTDYIPFLSSYVRGAFNGYENTVFRYNFDRYEHLAVTGPAIAEITREKTGLDVAPLFAEFLNKHYLFDQVVSVNDAGEAHVYSLKVESDCHSYVANGFVNHNTEARMSRMGEFMLQDIAKDTVNFLENYDGTRKEPMVLPSPVPQLLLNGTLGIAVGMATNIPPHNLKELIDALSYLIEHPKAITQDLFSFIKGPDFPTGGTIFNRQEIIEAYSQGKGPIVIRGKAEIAKEGKYPQIIISEIPFQVNKSSLVEQFAKLVGEKKIENIKDIRDESDKDGLRIVFDLQKDAHPQKILNRLYKFSDLQKTFHLNLLALVDGLQPKVLSLAEILSEFVQHRRQVITRRIQYDLARAKDREHILEGLHKCLANIDKVIKLIRGAQDRDDAKVKLQKQFRLSELQANAILDMRLAQLAKLEQRKIEDELKEVRAKIKELAAILASPKKIDEVIKKEFVQIKETFGDDRKTRVQVQGIGEIAEEDLVPQEETIITLTQGGYIKRINPATYKLQKRGGKGIVGMKTVSDDIVEHFLYCNTHDSLMVFTDSGKVFSLPVYEIPEGTRVAKGRGLLNFVELSSNDKVLNLFALGLPASEAGKKDAEQGVKHIVMATKYGLIKKTPLEDFKNVRKSGLIAISLKKGDELRIVKKSTGQDQIIVTTKKGQSIRFQEKDARAMGRTAAGTRAIRLKKGDEIVGMDVIEDLKKENTKGDADYLLILTENGYGKRTHLKEYRIQTRGGSGIKTANITPKTGNLVYARVLSGEEEDLIVISRKGQVIRTAITDIAKISRSTQGVRIMKLDGDDKVVSAASF